MWTLLILASCGPAFAQVLPDPKTVVPVDPTLFLVGIFAKDVRIEDASGVALAFTSTALANDVERLSVQASDGTVFFVVLPDRETTRRFGLRRGPWTVRARDHAIDRRAPTLSSAEELAYEGCTSADGWTLASDRSAPLWEFELTSAGTTRTAFGADLMVGRYGCARSTHSWTEADVSVRVRGLFADGSRGAWSNALTLEKPTLSLQRRLALATQSDHGPWVVLFAAFGLFIVAAVAGGAITRDRRPALHRPPHDSRG